MKKSFIAAVFYLVLGLLSGIFDREFTKAHSWSESQYTQLSVVHTHLLTLGFVVFLVVLALDKIFDLSADSRFKTFFVVYNLGILISSAMMTWHGIFTVLSGVNASWPEQLSLVAGLGHALMGLGLGFFLVILGPKVWAENKKSSVN
jgi:hypothetical protein